MVCIKSVNMGIMCRFIVKCVCVRHDACVECYNVGFECVNV